MAYIVKLTLNTRIPTEVVHEVKDLLWLPAEHPTYLNLYPRGRNGKYILSFPLGSILQAEIEDKGDEEIGRRK